MRINFVPTKVRLEIMVEIYLNNKDMIKVKMTHLINLAWLMSLIRVHY